MGGQGHFDGECNTDSFGHYVFANDAEEIKSHRWFRNLPWEQLHSITPPFIPRISDAEDTHYFDESEPVADWSETTHSPTRMNAEDVKAILGDFREEVQALAFHLVAPPHDSVKLKDIDQFLTHMSELESEEKEVLKHFVRLYGRKERKRPRDRLLRDAKTKDIVMDVRKQTAFMGYTWRRMRPEGYLPSFWES